MLYNPKLVKALALVLLAVPNAAAQSGPVALPSAGGQLAYRVAFRGKRVIEWSNLGLLLDGAPALGPAPRIESSRASSQDETWTPVQGKANPIRDSESAKPRAFEGWR